MTEIEPAHGTTPERSRSGSPPRKRVLVTAAMLLAQAAVVVTIAFFGLGGFGRDLRVPLDFSVDTLVYLAQSKGTLDNGWWWSNPRLAAPSTFAGLLFPSNTNVDQLVVWLTGRLVASPALAMNVAWIVMLVLSGFSATFGLRSLGMSRPASFVGGLLFALSPYALYRQLGHFSLVTYLMPFPAALAVHLATGLRARRSHRADYILLLAGCALLGFNYVYYAFFGCFFLVVSTAAGWWASRDRRVVRAGVQSVCVIALCVAANFAPSLYVASREGAPILIRDKMPAEADLYGLKIRHLVGPLFNHPFPPLRSWGDKERAAAFPLENENTVSRLGAVPSLGFLALLGTVLLASGSVRRPDSTLLAAGQLTIAGVLLSTIGGFGSLFNLLVSPDIRAYNRICPFFVFFALVAICIFIDRIARTRRPAGLALAAVLATIGLADQMQPLRGIAATHEGIREEYSALQGFVGGLEALLPPHAMVLQLPFTMYLNDIGRARMQSYDHFKPYLVSRHLRWSYPALANRQVVWQEGASQLRLEELAGYAAAQGFSAILIDRFGYADSANAARASLLGVAEARTIAENDRYIAIDIRRVQPPPSLTDAKLRELRSDAPVTPDLPACAGAPVVALDRVGAATAPTSASVEVARSEDLQIEGWAVHPIDKRAGLDVELEVQGLIRSTIYGFERPDVATYLNTPEARLSGFRGVIPGDLLPAGPAVLRVRVVSADGGCFYEVQAATLRVH